MRRDERVVKKTPAATPRKQELEDVLEADRLRLERTEKLKKFAGGDRPYGKKQ